MRRIALAVIIVVFAAMTTCTIAQVEVEPSPAGGGWIELNGEHGFAFTKDVVLDDSFVPTAITLGMH